MGDERTEPLKPSKLGNQPLTVDTVDLLRQAIDATEDPTEIYMSPRGARLMEAWLRENPEYIVD